MDQNTTTVLFARYRFTHVVHLAAQAGGFSLRNPGAYITANVMCTTALLEVIRKQPRPLPSMYVKLFGVRSQRLRTPQRTTSSTNQRACTPSQSKAQRTWPISTTIFTAYEARA